MKITQHLSKIKWLISSILLLFALTFIQCSDDESPAPDLTLTIDDTKINLKNAKIYSKDEYTNNGYTSRTYFISDGVPTNDSPGALFLYIDATYFLIIELGAKLPDDLSPGDFPSVYNWSTATGNNISYIYSEVTLDNGNVHPYRITENDPTTVKASGKFDEDEQITLSFGGNLLDESNGQLVPLKLYYSGKIIQL